MDHDTGAGGRIDARSSLVLDELGFFDPVETMDDMFCNANLMKGLDFNASDNSQYDDLFQGSVNGDSVDRSDENSQDFAVGEMFENISLLWSVDELLCDDDKEHGMCKGQQDHFEIQDRQVNNPFSRDIVADEGNGGNALVNYEKHDLDFLSQNEIKEGESMEPDDLSIEKKLEGISLVESVNDRELGFNEAILKETLTIEGSCGSSEEKQTEVKVEFETNPFKEIEEGEIVEYNQDVIDGWSDDDGNDDGDDDGDDEYYLFPIIKEPIRSKNEVKVLPSVLPVDIHLEEHHHTIPVGNVFSVIGPQVIVEGLENHRPLNEGSVLWMTATRSALGVVDEIFGPVKNPFYVVRYNSEDQVPSGVDRGDRVSYIPEFVSHILDENTLLRQKGYDASGENDEEVSDGDFSDDAKEEEHRRAARMMKRAAGAWIDNRNRRNGRPPRPRPSSLAGIRRLHFVRNRNRSSPSFPPSPGNNGYPPPGLAAAPTRPSAPGPHGPITPVSQSSPRARLPSPLPHGIQPPFLFQAQTQSPQKPKATHIIRPSPSQGTAPVFPQWDYAQAMAPPLPHLCPIRLPATQAAQPWGTAPPFSPQQCQQQQQNGMAPPFTLPVVVPSPVNQITQPRPAQSFPPMDLTQQPNMSFFQPPARIHQQSWSDAQMANIWVPAGQNHQPAPVFGTAFPGPNVDQSLVPNSPMPQPAPPGMPPARPTMPAAQPTMPAAQPTVLLAQSSLHLAWPCLSPAQPGMHMAQPTMNMAQPTVNMAQPNMSMAQPNMNMAQPSIHMVQTNMHMAQPSLSPAQPCVSTAQPCVSPAQPIMHMAQPSMHMAQPSMHMAQPSMHMAQPSMHMAQPSMHMAQPNMHMAQPSMHMAQPNMNMAQPNMNMAQPNMHMAQPNMHMAQPNMHMAQPNVYMAQTSMQTAQLSMSPQHSIHPAQPILPPAQPTLLPAHSSMHPAQQSIHHGQPAQESISLAQPCMSPAHQCMHMSQPNMHHSQSGTPPPPPAHLPPQPVMHPTRPNVHPTQPCMHMAQPSMHPPQPCVHPAQANMHQAQPSINPTQPGMQMAQPGIHMAQPGVHMAQSGVHMAQPCMHLAQPGVHMAQPCMHQAQPGVHMAQPGVHMAHPGVHMAQPGVHMAQPGVHMAQPGVHMAQPGVHMAQPGTPMAQTTSFPVPNMQTAGASSPALQSGQLVVANTVQQPAPPNGWPFPAHVPG